jgi:hypothetical protein
MVEGFVCHRPVFLVDATGYLWMALKQNGALKAVADMIDYSTYWYFHCVRSRTYQVIYDVLYDYSVRKNELTEN